MKQFMQGVVAQSDWIKKVYQIHLRMGNNVVIQTQHVGKSFIAYQVRPAHPKQGELF